MISVLDVQRALVLFGLEPVVARLFRQEFPGDDLSPTGARLVFGTDDRRSYMEIRGITGELPANLRLEGERIFASGEEQPGDWHDITNERDAHAFRVFTTFDPRRLSDQMTAIGIRELEADRQVVTASIDLGTWHPKLPDDLLEWLGDAAHGRTLWLELRHGRLNKLTTYDLPPRSADIITAIFEYPAVASNHNGT